MYLPPIWEYIEGDYSIYTYTDEKLGKISLLYMLMFKENLKRSGAYEFSPDPFQNSPFFLKKQNSVPFIRMNERASDNQNIAT